MGESIDQSGNFSVCNEAALLVVEVENVHSGASKPRHRATTSSENVMFVGFWVVTHVEHHMGYAMSRFPCSSPENEVSRGKFFKKFLSGGLPINIIEELMLLEPVILVIGGSRHIFDANLFQEKLNCGGAV